MRYLVSLSVLVQTTWGTHLGTTNLRGGVLPKTCQAAPQYDQSQLHLFCFLQKKLGHLLELSPVPKELQGQKSCAVVSSSGGLLMHTNGMDIDKHDVVFRFNKAPTEGYEINVGMTTTFRLGWDWPDNQKHKGLAPRNVPRAAAAAAIKSLYPAEPKKGETEHPTSGFYGMLLALKYCHTVDAYEMAPSDYASISPYSYYSSWQTDRDDAKYNPWHGYMHLEHDIWRRLSTNERSIVKATGKTSYLGVQCTPCSNVSF